MNVRFLSGWRIASAALFALAALAACTVVVEEPPVARPLPPGPGFCTREYAPVCARRGPDRQTFANACLAESAGYRIIYDGGCRYDGGGGGTFCTREYAPVCAERYGRTRTFGNACEARAAGYRILFPDTCE